MLLIGIILLAIGGLSLVSGFVCYYLVSYGEVNNSKRLLLLGHALIASAIFVVLVGAIFTTIGIHPPMARQSVVPISVLPRLSEGAPHYNCSVRFFNSIAIVTGPIPPGTGV